MKQVIAIGATMLVVAVMVITALTPTESKKIEVKNMELPSPAAIQELLNKLEPEPRLKVDGKIGPLTLKKWNRVYCEQSARKASEGYYK